MSSEEWTVKLKDGAKITIRRGKISSYEMEKLRKNREKIEMIISRINDTGRWWEAWQRDEVIESLRRAGYLKTVEVAIEGLKRIFTPEWFKENKEHPMWHILLYTALTDDPVKNNPLGLFELITIGYAIAAIGELDPNLAKDLQGKENFYPRSFELRVKAFLKNLNPPAVLEEEFVDRIHRVPDASWKDYDFEIKSLEESVFDREFRRVQEKITKEIKEIFNSFGFVGEIVYDISLGKIKSVRELRESIDTIKNLIISSKSQILNLVEKEGGEVSLGKDDVQVDLYFKKSKYSSISGFVKLSDPFPLHFRRIQRIVNEAAEKVREKPMIVIVNPPESAVFHLADEVIRIPATHFIFSPYLTPREERVMREVNEAVSSIDSGKLNEIKEKIKEIEEIGEKIKEKFEKLRKIKEVWLFVPIPISKAGDLIRKEPLLFGAVVIENPFFGLSFKESAERNIEGLRSFKQKLDKIIKGEERLSPPKMVIGVSGKFVYI